MTERPWFKGLTDQEIEQIEAFLKARLDQIKGRNAALDAQHNFLAGAIATLHVLGGGGDKLKASKIPMIWQITFALRWDKFVWENREDLKRNKE